ncbi:hypothetical protein AB6A40_006577 [Gnathostoma spinigerum]|uniref:Uncharacterized protein n=1 Tax=Gnathostoma spinigerum TaxID=75299 RepID=A0ABD6EIR2_9BILA
MITMQQTIISRDEYHHNCRHHHSSPLGHLWSRLNSRRSRSKSPSLMMSSIDSALSTPKRKSVSIEGDEMNRTSTKPAASAKDTERHCSPLSRVFHRLSMSRKPRRSASKGDSSDRISELSRSREMVYHVNSPTTPKSLQNTQKRTFVSEGDLHNVSMRTDASSTKENLPDIARTTLCLSENNLVVNTPRTPPSYLRVSCALNGYHNYRRREVTPGTTPTLSLKPLPMSNVERRTQIFNGNGGEPYKKPR